MEGRWRQPEAWRAWWRDRVSFEQKAAFGVLCLGGLLVAGWLGADSLSSASASVDRTTAQTAERVVTVREAGKAVTTRVPEVKRVFVTRREKVPGVTVVRTETAYGANTVTVPRYVTHVVTAPARTVTQLVTTVATTVEWHVITVVEKSPPVTVTVTAPAP